MAVLLLINIWYSNVYSTGGKHLLLLVRIDQSITENIHLGKQGWKDFASSSTSMTSAESSSVLSSRGIFKLVRFLSPPLPSVFIPCSSVCCGNSDTDSIFFKYNKIIWSVCSTNNALLKFKCIYHFHCNFSVLLLLSVAEVEIK